MSHHGGDPHDPHRPAAEAQAEVSPEVFLEGIKSKLEYVLPEETEFLNLVEQLRGNHVSTETLQKYLQEVKHMKELLVTSLQDMRDALNVLPPGTEIPEEFKNFFDPTDTDTKNILNRENAIRIVEELIIFLEKQYKKLVETEKQRVQRMNLAEFLSEGKFFTGKDILQAIEQSGGAIDVDIFVRQLEIQSPELYSSFQETDAYQIKKRFFDEKEKMIHRETFFGSPELDALEAEVQRQSAFLFENEIDLKRKGEYRVLETALRAKIAERDALLQKEKEPQIKIQKLAKSIEEQYKFLRDNEFTLQTNGKFDQLTALLKKNEEEYKRLNDPFKNEQDIRRNQRLDALSEERKDAYKDAYKKFLRSDIPAHRAVDVLAYTDASPKEIVKKLAEKIAPGSVTFELVFELPDEILQAVISSMDPKLGAMEVKRQGPLFWSKSFGEQLSSLRKSYEAVLTRNPFGKFPTDYEKRGVHIEDTAPEFVHHLEHTQEALVHAAESHDKNKIAKAKAQRNRLFAPEILRIATLYRMARAINGYPTDFDPQGDIKGLDKMKYKVGSDVTGYPNEIKRVEFSLQTFDLRNPAGRGARIMVDENDVITVNFKRIDDPEADILFDSVKYPHITPDKIAFALAHAYKAAEKPKPFTVPAKKEGEEPQPTEVKKIEEDRDALTEALEKIKKVRYFKTALQILFERLAFLDRGAVPPEQVKKVYEQCKNEYNTLKDLVVGFNASSVLDSFDVSDAYGEEFEPKFEKFVSDQVAKVEVMRDEPEVGDLVDNIETAFVEIGERLNRAVTVVASKPIERQITDWEDEPVESKKNILYELDWAREYVSNIMEQFAVSNKRLQEYESERQLLVEAEEFNKNVKYNTLGSILFSTKKRAWGWSENLGKIVMEEMTKDEFVEAQQKIESRKSMLVQALAEVTETRDGRRELILAQLSRSGREIELQLEMYRREPGITLTEKARFQTEIKGVWELFCARIQAQLV